MFGIGQSGKNLKDLTGAVRRLAEGQLDITIPSVGRQDEIGDMARAIEAFRNKAQQLKAMEIELDVLRREGGPQQEQRDQRFGNEVGRLLEHVAKGNFDQRVSLEGKSGAFATISQQINHLVDGLAKVTQEICQATNAVANGDLTHKITTNYDGRFGELRDNTNRISETMAGIVGQIQAATGEVKSASSEITSGTEDLSNRTEQAASNLEETAASTEEMAATVKQNADNAKNASQLAASADQSAKTGGEVVEKAVNAMAQIEESAQKITDIISVIDEIAFQTNLLALNASVEAARAGEAGKGFAVVAQEVRQLAQRSSQAADDIKTLIQNSNGQVKAGVQLVNKAGEALTEIVGSIGRVAGIVREISSASQEQAAGVQEINSSITSLDEVTQQNSALVEESTAAARALSDQASSLGEIMTFFKSPGGRMPKPSTAGRARPAASMKRSQPTMASSEGGWDEF